MCRVVPPHAHWVSRAPNFQRALEALVRSDLTVGYHRGTTPQPELRARNRIILHLTFLRHLYTRAGTELEAPVGDTSEHFLGEALLDYFNGDWTLQRLTHLCNGCCENYETSVHRAVSLLMASLMDTLGARLPSSHRCGYTQRGVGFRSVTRRRGGGSNHAQLR